MKQSLQLRMGQSLAMTPQLQQAIRLLQLSTLELQSEIQEALEANPLLEVSEDDNGAPSSSDSHAGADSEAPATTDFDISSPAADIPESHESEKELSATTQDMPDELPIDSAWEDTYDSGVNTPMMGTSEDTRDFTEYSSSGEESLRDHLLEQAFLRPLSQNDLVLATCIIDAIDDDGYLADSLEEILSGANSDREIEDHLEVEDAEAVHQLVMQLDPIGCAARDLGECMSIQLQQLAEQPGLEAAKRIVTEQLNLLGAHDYNKLRRELKISENELRVAISVIRSLNPRPGAQISSRKAEYIVPDVFVKRARGTWRVELNPDIAPKLGINALYAGMVKRADRSSDNTFIRNHLQEARWFIKSLQSRNETLLRVGTAIIEHQRDFLEHGEVAMKPLVLRDIAEQLEMHESTISRVTTQKYMHTPRGIFEFKYFFSSHVSTADGGECSATAIRAMIKTLIAKENTQQPLSDSKIAKILVAEGIKVARRTIAKYREAMAIPPSNERKRLN